MMSMNTKTNIRPLNAGGARTLEFNNRQEAYQRKVHLRRRFILVAFMIATVIYAMVCFHQQYNKYTTASASLEKTQTQLASAKTTHQNLKQEVKDLGDESYLEKLVREKYMYTKDGEIVFNLPGE